MALLLFRACLEVIRFTIRTYQDSLNRILKISESSDRIAHLRLQLLKFVFDVVHRAGVKHQATGALLKLLCSEEESTLLEDELSLLVIGISHIFTGTLICVIDQNTNGVITWSGQQTEVSINTPRTEGKILVEHAQDIYFKTATS